jgi:hypothetical protein
LETVIGGVEAPAPKRQLVNRKVTDVGVTDSVGVPTGVTTGVPPGPAEAVTTAVAWVTGVCVGRPLPGEVAVALAPPLLLLEEELDDALAPEAVNGAKRIEMPPRGATK